MVCYNIATAIENLCMALYSYILKNYILKSHINHIYFPKTTTDLQEVLSKMSFGGYVRRGLCRGFVFTTDLYFSRDDNAQHGGDGLNAQ